MAHKFFVTSDDKVLGGFTIHTGSSRLGDPSLLTIVAPTAEFQLNPRQAEKLRDILNEYAGDVLTARLPDSGGDDNGLLEGIKSGLGVK